MNSISGRIAITLAALLGLQAAEAEEGTIVAICAAPGLPDSVVRCNFDAAESGGPLDATTQSFGQLSVTADGKQMAYRGSGAEGAVFFVSDLDASNPRSEGDASAFGPPAISPDGTRIAYGAVNSGEIFVRDLGTDAVSQVASGGYWTQLEWDPTGERLAFRSRSQNALLVVAADGTGDPETVYATGASTNPTIFGFDWSPLGDEIVVIERVGEGFRQYEVRRVSLGGSGATTVHSYSTSFLASAVEWSPDGSQLAIIAGDNEARTLGVIPVDGGTFTTLFDSTIFDTSAFFVYNLSEWFVEKKGVDLSILANNQVTQVGDQTRVRFEITVTNEGALDVEGVSVSARYLVPPSLSTETVETEATGIPKQLHLLERPSCVPEGSSRPFSGSTFNCRDIDLRGVDDPFGRNFTTIEFETRVLNLADLPAITFEVIHPDDENPNNNTDRTNILVRPMEGSIAATREAMTALDPFFDYETDLISSQCNDYRLDIYERFEQIRLEHPEAFEDLAYGPITSGDYILPVIGTTAAHVGVVIYQKGTDYHETGIVVHGLPTPSQLSVFSERFDTQVGTFPIGEVPAEFEDQWTASIGFYYRTPVAFFPGQPRPEAAGCGFEGLYSDNADEFAQIRICRPGKSLEKSLAQTCPVAPEAVVIRTESPVELRVTNSDGQVVETLRSAVIRQELDSSIVAMAFPHPDGTFAWDLSLPADDYEIDLIGTADGPYRLTMTRFPRFAESVSTVIEGVASTGVIESFQFIDTLFSTSFEDE